MAEFKIDGRMTVRTLKENFKKEFEGTLRVYNGREKADDSATLAAIRTGDAKGGELICRSSRTVGKFEEEMMEVFGIKVQVASPDDWVLALDGITLANLKNIPKQARKADMESLVAYKRKNSQTENDLDTQVKENTEKVLLDGKYKSLPIIDFKFKEVDWELNEENIEARREDLNELGVVYVKAGEDDFEVVVIADDIIDGLYQAIDEVENFINDGYENVKVYYTTVCEFYGVDEEPVDVEVYGCVLSSLASCEDNDYCYSLESPVICRAIWDDYVQMWITDEYGDHDCELDLDIDLLIAYKKDPNSVADRIEWKDPTTQCMNTKGQLLFEVLGDYSPVWINNNDLIYVELDRKYGILNMQGEEVQPCKYTDVSGFPSSNGWTVVQYGGKYSFINEKGEEVKFCQYDYAYGFFSSGLARVIVDGENRFINDKGEEVLSCKYDIVDNFSSNGLARVSRASKYGFINEKGEEVIPCNYDGANSFETNGLAQVKKDKKIGFINENGQEIVPCTYKVALQFRNGFAPVKFDGYWGFVNEKGEEIIPCKYDDVNYFSPCGLAKVNINGEYRFVNETGEEVISCKYDKVDNFSPCGLARVSMKGKYGFINETGEEVISCKYGEAEDFSPCGLAKVNVNGKYGFINETGEEVISCKYDEAEDFSSKGLSKIKIGEQYGCINRNGDEVIPCKYSQLEILEELIFVKV